MTGPGTPVPSLRSAAAAILTRAAGALPVKISLGRGADIVILVNRNLKMTPGKTAAQAVHAALAAHGIDHGAVIVLHASPSRIRAECDTVVHDAGATEVEPGSLTAGVRRPGAGTDPSA